MKKTLMVLFSLFMFSAYAFALDYIVIGDNEKLYEEQEYSGYDFEIEGNIEVEIEDIELNEDDYKSIEVYPEGPGPRIRALIEYLKGYQTEEEQAYFDSKFFTQNRLNKEPVLYLSGMIKNRRNIESLVAEFDAQNPQYLEEEEYRPLLTIFEVKFSTRESRTILADDLVMVFFNQGELVRTTPFIINDKGSGIVSQDITELAMERRSKYDLVYNHSWGSYPAAVEYKGQTVCILVEEGENSIYDDFIAVYGEGR